MDIETRARGIDKVGRLGSSGVQQGENLGYSFLMSWNVSLVTVKQLERKDDVDRGQGDATAVPARYAIKI